MIILAAVPCFVTLWDGSIKLMFNSLYRSWVWSAGHPQTQIDLNFNDGFDIAAHRLRNAWRLYQWKSFLKTQRHEVSELAHIADNVILTIDWKKLRNLIKTSPNMRSVSVGALLSPAAVARNPRSPFDDRCIWGECSELGSHEHICWSCPHRPSKLRPVDALDARYGWRKEASLRWLGKVQERIWETRYGKPYGPNG